MKKLLIGNIFIIVGVALGIIALFMPFAAGMVASSGSTTMTLGSGFEFIFGSSDNGIDAVAVGTTGWVLLLLGLLGAIAIVPLAYVTKNGLRIGKLTFGQAFSAFAALLMIIGGILILCLRAGYVAGDTSSLASYIHLGVGPILSGIFAILAALCILIPLFLPYFVKRK